MRDIPLISVVLSFRNEADVLGALVDRLRNVLLQLEVRYELIFINDDSTDNSQEILQELRAADPCIKILTTSRRMGVSECVLAGFRYSTGDAVVYMDTDLQDPPEVISELFAKWVNGADVAYTVRLSREGESRFKLMATAVAYRVINRISSVDLPVDAGDFKLLSRRVVDLILQLRERNPYLRGMIAWAGFRQEPVFYVRQRRAGGTTHFPLLRSIGPLKMLVLGITSYSLVPVMMALVVGTALLALAPVLLLVLVLGALLGDWVSAAWWIGWGLYTSTALHLFFLGWASLYIGRIFDDVRRRPNFIIKDAIGFDVRESLGTAIDVGERSLLQ